MGRIAAQVYLENMVFHNSPSTDMIAETKAHALGVAFPLLGTATGKFYPVKLFRFKTCEARIDGDELGRPRRNRTSFSLSRWQLSKQEIFAVHMCHTGIMH